jgi:hypothetical protein
LGVDYVRLVLAVPVLVDSCSWATLSGIENAPHHITAIKDDVEGFYSILGNLEHVIDCHDDIPAIESLQLDAFDALTKIIEHRVAVFNFVSLSGNAKKSPLESFQLDSSGDESGNYGRELMGHKMSLCVELSTIHL